MSTALNRPGSGNLTLKHDRDDKECVARRVFLRQLTRGTCTCNTTETSNILSMKRASGTETGTSTTRSKYSAILSSSVCTVWMDTTTCTSQHLWTVGTWRGTLQTKKKKKTACAFSRGRRTADEQHQWNWTFCVIETCICPVTVQILTWKCDAVHAARQGTRLCTRVLCLERVLGASATHSISTQGIRWACNVAVEQSALAWKMSLMRSCVAAATSSTSTSSKPTRKLSQDFVYI